MTHRDPEPDDDDNGPWCQNEAAMNRTLHYARGTAAAAVLLTAGACFGATYTWWLAGSGLYAAAVFAWCARREYAAYRRERAIAVRLERLRRGEAVIEPPRPCCQFWQSSDGAIHGHDCTRPPAARTTLSLAEQTAWGAITAGFEKDQAA